MREDPHILSIYGTSSPSRNIRSVKLVCRIHDNVCFIPYTLVYCQVFVNILQAIDIGIVYVTREDDLREDSAATKMTELLLLSVGASPRNSEYNAGGKGDE